MNIFRLKFTQNLTMQAIWVIENLHLGIVHMINQIFG